MPMEKDAEHVNYQLESMLSSMNFLYSGNPRTSSHCQNVHSALTRMLAVSALKLGWVHDVPFAIWQVDCRESARHFMK